MEVHLQRHSQCLVFRIVGDFRLWNHDDREHELITPLPAALEAPPPGLVLVLQGLTHIDSRSITALARVLTQCVDRGIEFAVVLPGGVPGDALKRIRVFDSWPQFKDEASALEAIEPAAMRQRWASVNCLIPGRLHGSRAPLR